MNYTLILHSQVEDDVDEAYNWYENQKEGLGELFLEELAVCYRRLEAHPHYYTQVSKSYRRIRLNHFPYIVAYEIIEQNVFVYAVFHSSRNQKAITKRKKHGRI